MTSAAHMRSMDRVIRWRLCYARITSPGTVGREASGRRQVDLRDGEELAARQLVEGVLAALPVVAERPEIAGNRPPVADHVHRASPVGHHAGEAPRLAAVLVDQQTVVGD